jgi:hypothetical protein
MGFFVATMDEGREHIFVGGVHRALTGNQRKIAEIRRDRFRVPSSGQTGRLDCTKEMQRRFPLPRPSGVRPLKKF